ncbi:DUF418 domain-containing protein [Paenibacillus agaridevorans]|uniref:DUF418 domain-containing protein n=1 Tax=Paenibacillus agaridevorans TaxID=171404 RepID=UPI001BE4A6F1|nr:DUF418 domain-containing protein [Paenibacillus agaridevorans]
MKRSNVEPNAGGREARAAHLDMIRGLALLGIVIANMPLFASASVYMNMVNVEWWSAAADLLVKQLIYIAIDYKFISIFSFLFGAGFILFLQNAERKGRRGTALYIRRLVVLLLFGALHSYFIWLGDILLVYAMLGFALLAFYRRKLNTLLYTALGLLLIPAAWIAAHTFAPELVPWGLPLGPSADEALRLLHDSNAVYSGGTYEEIFRQRLVDLSHLQNSSLLTIPLTFAMFLLGAYGWQKGWLRDPDRHVAAIRKVWRWSGGIGILFLAFQLWLYHTVDAGQIGFNTAHWAGILIAGPAIALFYMASLLLLIRRSFWRQLFTPLQAAGRMALTNYLLQSFVCTFLFYSYGLGWYGQIAPSIGLALSLLIFAVQVWLSGLWLRRFRFGPFEWVWRSLTYGKRQSMKNRCLASGDD